MSANTFITNSQTHTLKKLQDELIQHSKEILYINKSAREETLSLTEEAVRVGREIDERVKALYGV